MLKEQLFPAHFHRAIRATVFQAPCSLQVN